MTSLMLDVSASGDATVFRLIFYSYFG